MFTGYFVKIRALNILYDTQSVNISWVKWIKMTNFRIDSTSTYLWITYYLYIEYYAPGIRDKTIEIYTVVSHSKCHGCWPTYHINDLHDLCLHVFPV